MHKFEISTARQTRCKHNCRLLCVAHCVHIYPKHDRCMRSCGPDQNKNQKYFKCHLTCQNKRHEEYERDAKENFTRTAFFFHFKCFCFGCCPMADVCSALSNAKEQKEIERPSNHFVFDFHPLPSAVIT